MLVYNTLTRRKEKFIPRDEGKVAMYVCGPTTYNYIHLGNARPVVFFDTVRRYLTYKGYQVLYVQNFTDIDDKIIQRANELGEDPAQLAQRFIQEYFQDADALNVQRAHTHPRVSEHLPEIINLVQDLIDKGHAYEAEGDVYFEVRKFNDYGKLSGRNLDDLRSGARVEVDARKRDPLDFALWKAAKPGEPFWPSPWGNGRPGWHIECSAMALKYLGKNFDIHGGGYDLVFPHHENEVAQTEAATGQNFARYWLHNGFITVNQEKMSKSLGNFFLVREILSQFAPEVVRFYLLSTHYRSPLDFDDEKLAAATRGLGRIKTSIGLLAEALAKNHDVAATTPDPAMLKKLDGLRLDFEQAMDDDFNTALAIAVLFDLAKEVNIYLSKSANADVAMYKSTLQSALALFEDFNQVLGVFKQDTAGRLLLKAQDEQQEPALTEALIGLIIELRQQARQKKDWATADHIRDKLKELQIILEDTPDGVRWKKQG